MSRIAYIENMETWESEFSFFIPVSVRFSETDMFGHMNNVVPFTYFEEARIKFFHEVGVNYDWSEEDGEMIPVVADLQCDYIRQVYFHENLKLYVKVKSVGRSSVDIHYMAKNDKNHICFVGRGTMVNISRETGKGIPWPASWREGLMNGTIGA